MTFFSAEQLQQRTRAALAAAVDAARERGLEVGEPVVLHDLFSVVVHLQPSPVVARVPVVLDPAETQESLLARQRSELSVTQWLADQGVPVLEPSPLLPSEPVQHDGFSMTWWTYVDQDHTQEPDYALNCERTAALHHALSEFPGELSFLSSAQPDVCTASLRRLEGLPQLIDPVDLARAQEEWHLLEPLVRSQSAFERTSPGIDLQTLHGDCPPANLFAGFDGPRFADFEMVTFGPVEWDLATLDPALHAAYDRGAHDLGRRPLDPDVLSFVSAVGMLQAISALSLVPQLPPLLDHLAPALEQWRGSPPADVLERLS